MKAKLGKKGSLGPRRLLAVALATIWTGPALAAIDCTSQVTLTGGVTETCTDLVVTTTTANTDAVNLTGPNTTLNVTGTGTVMTSGTSSTGIKAGQSSIVNFGSLPASITTSGEFSRGVSVTGDPLVGTRGGGHVMIGSPVQIDPVSVAPTDSFVTLSSGKITAGGWGAVGIQAIAGTGGKAQVTIGEAGAVETTDAQSRGIVVGSDNEASVVVLGSVRSAGDGVEVQDASKAQLTVEPGGKIETGKIAVAIMVSGEASILNSGIITSTGSHAIDTSYSNTGPIRIENAGEITAIGNTTPGLSETTYAISGSNETEAVTTTAGGIKGHIHLGFGDDTLSAEGGEFIGNIYMGGENDIATFKPAAGLAGLGVLDGEGPFRPGVDGEIPLPPEARLQWTNTLNLSNTLTGSTTGAGVGVGGNTQILNWDNVNIGDATNAGRLNLTGDLNNGRGAGSLGAMTISPVGTLALAAGTPTARVDYNVTNHGTIDLTQGAATPTGHMIIAGNYSNAPGAQVLVKSIWNNPDVQQNDKLEILGNATGATTVAVPGGIIGDVTQGDAIKNGGLASPVVIVRGTDTGTAAPQTFSGTADTTNAGQAQLVKVADSYYWTLQARQPDVIPPPIVPVVPAPQPTGPTIYAPGVPGYVQMARANREMGFAQLGKLHERVGEQQTWAWDDCGTRCAQYRDLTAAGKKPYPIWGRIGASTLKEQGRERLGYKSDTAFIQFGADLNVNTDAARNHQHMGVMASYSRGEHDFYDKYRAVNGVVSPDKKMGSGTTDMFSLGAYSTWYSTNGTYVDLVGNASYIRNKYKSASGRPSQNGYGLGASVEVGRPWQLGESRWMIEPQAQLSYQYVHLGDFDDDVRNIDKQNGGTLRGRLGARLAYNADNGRQRTNTFYVTANVLHDITGNKSKATIGRDSITENYGRTWAEVGVGAQFPLGKATYVFGDVKYERSLSNNSNDVFRGNDRAREGYSGRIGLRYTW